MGKALRLSVKRMTGVSYYASHSSRIRNTYFAKSLAGVRLANLASVVFNATKVCFLVRYRTSPLATKTACSPVKCREGSRSAREASAKVFIIKLAIESSLPLNSKPYSAVLLRYRNRCFIKSR